MRKYTKMLMPKKNKRAIYEYIFKEGVIVVEKDCQKASHEKLEKIPNLHVMKTLQSLKSKGYVKETFAWRHHYYYLNNEGVEYLRTFLNLSPQIVPATYKRPQSTAPVTRRSMPARSERKFDERSTYRRMGPETEKKTEVGAGNAVFEFRQGFGRGASRQ